MATVHPAQDSEQPFTIQKYTHVMDVAKHPQSKCAWSRCQITGVHSVILIVSHLNQSNGLEIGND